jgi:hypothetical protein
MVTPFGASRYRRFNRGTQWLRVSLPDVSGERLLSCARCEDAVVPVVKEGRDGKAKIVGVYCCMCEIVNPLPRSFVMPPFVDLPEPVTPCC